MPTAFFFDSAINAFKRALGIEKPRNGPSHSKAARQAKKAQRQARKKARH